VQAWIGELLVNLQSATVQFMILDRQIYRPHLSATCEVVPETSAPFDKIRLKVRKQPWQPWEPKELVKLHRRANERSDAMLANLLMLLMYSGTRLSEICNLKVSGVTDDHFNIADAKTQAGIRTVPTHDD